MAISRELLEILACPKCKGDPGEYLKQVAAFSNSESGWMNYTNRSWLSGRKILCVP